MRIEAKATKWPLVLAIAVVALAVLVPALAVLQMMQMTDGRMDPGTYPAAYAAEALAGGGVHVAGLKVVAVQTDPFWLIVEGRSVRLDEKRFRHPERADGFVRRYRTSPRGHPGVVCVSPLANGDRLVGMFYAPLDEASCDWFVREFQDAVRETDHKGPASQ